MTTDNTDASTTSGDCCHDNIGELESRMSIGAGVGLALYGLSRRSWGGFATALLGGGFLVQRGIMRHCHLYEALGVDTSGHEFAAHDAASFKPSIPVKHGFIVEKSVTVDKPRNEVFSFWRNLENLPRFMTHLESVQVLDAKRSRWVARAPVGQTVEWEAAITDERENEVIAWHSAENASVHNTGSVRFHDAASGSGTDVKVVLQYRLPAGSLGALLFRLFGEEPAVQIENDLQRFKTLLEAGKTSSEAPSPAA